MVAPTKEAVAATGKRRRRQSSGSDTMTTRRGVAKKSRLSCRQRISSLLKTLVFKSANLHNRRSTRSPSLQSVTAVIDVNVVSYNKQLPYIFPIVFVDDGSQDKTSTVLTVDNAGAVGTKYPDANHFVSVSADVELGKCEVTTFSSFAFLMQVIFPFLIAGAGMVGAGVVLDIVQHWRLFSSVPETFVLVPALLGLKGNLEMTLASRLSTLANLGKMDTRQQQFQVLCSNVALIQVQAVVVAFIASLLALGITAVHHQQPISVTHSLMLCASGMTTAATASMALATVMVIVVIGARRLRIDPDNVTTPIAASLGDLTTLGALVVFGSLFLTARDTRPLMNVVVVSGIVAALPFWTWAASRHLETRRVLREGWWPILAAMVISSGGGFILSAAVGRFPGIAVFQPVINGVGGNLVAVQASRLSTMLHKSSVMGKLPLDRGLGTFLNIRRAFFCNESDSRSARILMFLVIPGHTIFIIVIYAVKAGHVDITALFLLGYLIAALMQVFVLLYLCQWLVRLMWKWSIDPDNSAIPYLTSLGDLFGTGLLALVFIILHEIGQPLGGSFIQ